MATPSWEVRLSKHSHDLDADGHDIHAPLVVLECNTNMVAGTSVLWDKFYDGFGNNLSHVMPVGMGLTTSDFETFTATEDVLLLLDIQFFLKAAPGHVGTITLSSPANYLGWVIFVAASGNSTDEYRRFTSLFIASGDTFSFDCAGINPDVLATYADIQIVRIA